MDPVVWMYFASLNEMTQAERQSHLLGSAPVETPPWRWRWALLTTLLCVVVPALMLVMVNVFPPTYGG